MKPPAARSLRNRWNRKHIELLSDSLTLYINKIGRSSLFGPVILLSICGLKNGKSRAKGFAQPSDQPLGHHGFGHLQEAGDIGPVSQVARNTVALGDLDGLIVNAVHNHM